MPDGTVPRPLLTLKVAGWLSALRLQGVLVEVTTAMRLPALGTVGAGLAGAALPWTNAIRRWALAGVPDEASTGPAQIWGGTHATLRAAAASAAGPALGFDDLAAVPVRELLDHAARRDAA